LICEITGFKGQIVHDLSKPDGTYHKLMSAQKLSDMGWSPSIFLRDGIRKIYGWFFAECVAVDDGVKTPTITSGQR
jgi:GDP-L-fucose synthase